MKMDSQQTQAVNHLGTNTIVSASAGAGKTRVLVERLLKRCIVDRVPIDQILAVTFTEAAAGEMKNRVASRLQEELNATTDDHTKAYLQEQLIRLDQAWITTIDSFCLRIIEKYSNVIGLDPAISKHILSDGQQKALMRQAFFDALDKCQNQYNHTFLDGLYYMSARSENYDNLLRAITAIINKAQSLSDVDAWFDRAKESYQPVKSIKKLPAPIKHAFFSYLKMYYDAAQRHLSSLILLGESHDLKEASMKQLLAVKNTLTNCEAPLRKMDYGLFYQHFENFGGNAIVPTMNNEHYKNMRDAFYKDIEELSKVLFPEKVFLQDQHFLAAMNELLVEMARTTRDNYQEAKRLQTAMDFNDMEQYAWQILTVNDNAISHLYQQQFQEVMVDEFQDTSVLQNEIIKKVAKPGTIFRVGDVKQSIYRFRQAKPALMRELMEHEEETHIVLQHNYRSKQNIVDFNNELFKTLMNVDGCYDSYTEEDFVSTGSSTQVDTPENTVQLVLIEQPEDTAVAYDAKGEKAKWIVAEMQRLVAEEGFAYKDFCVLVRSHLDKSVFRYAFETYGIPYDIDAREGFFHSQICQTVIQIMEAMLNPTNAFALLTVVTSALYQMTDETLAQLTIQYGSFYNGLKETNHPVFEDLNTLRHIAQEEGITAFLNALIQKNAFFEHSTTKDQANFDYLFEQALHFEQDGCTIYDLLELMRSSEDEKSSEAISRGKDDDVVTVTTIHQSKGLQYKVVFLYGTGVNQDHDAREFVMVDDDLYLGLKHMDLDYRTLRTSPQRLALEYKVGLEDLEEFTRLLYVALTRAEEKLYIVDVDKNSEDPQTITLDSLQKRSGITGLISMAQRDIHSAFEVVRSPMVEPRHNKLPKQSKQTLPTFKGNASTLAPLLRPSEHELTTLPNIEPKSTDRNTQYGTTMHEVLASLPNTPWTKEQLQAYHLRPSDEEKILNFGKSAIYTKALTMNIHKEYPFYVTTTTNRIYGIMDFVAIGDDEVLLLDFKTDALANDEIKMRYQDQIHAYTEALHVLYPQKRITPAIYSLHNNATILFDQSYAEDHHQ